VEYLDPDIEPWSLTRRQLYSLCNSASSLSARIASAVELSAVNPNQDDDDLSEVGLGELEHMHNIYNLLYIYVYVFTYTYTLYIYIHT